MRALAAQVAEQWLSACLRQLGQAALDRHAATVSAALRSALAHWTLELGRHIQRGITAAQLKRRPQLPRAPQAPRSLSELSLVDEEQAEREIEISRVIQQVDLEAEWELRELIGLASALQIAHGEPMGLNQYPAAPAVYARALAELARSMNLAAPQRAALMRAGGPAGAAVLKLAYAEASEQIRSWGVLEARYQRGPAPPPLRQGSAASLGSSMRQLLASPRLQTGDADPSVALLARLFQQMLADPRLQGPLRRVVARLQGTVQKTAQRDRSVLVAQDHPVWQLIEQIAAYGAEHAQPADDGASDFLRFVEPLVDGLAAGAAPPREAYAQALQELHDFVRRDEAAELVRAAPVQGLLRQAEHEDNLRPLLRQQVQLQLERGPAVPALLRQFLSGTWVDVMAHAVVHLGEASPETQALISTVDELLRSLRPAPDAAERQRRLQALPGLIANLQRGMQLLHLPHARAQELLDGLMRAHRALLQATPPAPSATPTQPASAAIEWDDDAAYRRGPAAAAEGPSDTHLGHLPTVPMGMNAESAAAAAAAWMQGLRPGQRCKIFLQGRWITVRLMWQSESGGFFLFAAPLDGASHPVTRRALERLRAEGLVTDVAEPSLLQRAVDRLMEDL